MKKSFYIPAGLRKKRAAVILEKFRAIFDKCGSDSYVSKLQYLDIKTYLCDDILAKVDRASMANSLEVRVPILDHEFMQYAASIPSGLKIKNCSGKYIFKKAMSRNLPDGILRRPKMGFSVPMSEWLRNELKDAAEKELFDRGGIIAELFDREYVDKIWRMALAGKKAWFRKTDLSYRVWILFVFARWFKRYIKNG